jgi:hypothetical protein
LRKKKLYQQSGRSVSAIQMAAQTPPPAPAAPAPAPAAPVAKARQEFDIQHDDEFEDFQVKTGVVSDKNRASDLLDDWDDDVVEDFSAILQEQRARLS